MNKISKTALLNRCHASENQNERKIQTENKIHQYKNLKINSIQVLEIYQLAQETLLRSQKTLNEGP